VTVADMGVSTRDATVTFIVVSGNVGISAAKSFLGCPC
jgi:hypothetical protein